jgi:hypothetical protein
VRRLKRYSVGKSGRAVRLRKALTATQPKQQQPMLVINSVCTSAELPAHVSGGIVVSRKVHPFALAAPEL